MAKDCLSCGAVNGDDARFCSTCGEEMRIRSARKIPVVTEKPSTKVCGSCGREIDASFLICPYCGKDYRAVAPIVAAEGVQRKPLSSHLGVASLLMIIAGVFSLAGLAIFNQDFFGTKASMITPLENMEMVVWATSAIIGMAGTYFIVFRPDFGIAMTAGVFATVAGFPIYYVGMIPGIVAIILIVLARKEFP